MDRSGAGLAASAGIGGAILTPLGLSLRAAFPLPQNPSIELNALLATIDLPAMPGPLV